MSNYIKPTISLVSTASGVRGVASCQTQLSKQDSEMILQLFGITDINNAFGTTEGCTVMVPDTFGYCKFTSGDLGNAQIFSS